MTKKARKKEELAEKASALPELTEEEKKKAEEDFLLEIKNRKEDALDKHSSEVVDNVKLHLEGWKERYYTDKCKAEVRN